MIDKFIREYIRENNEEPDNEKYLIKDAGKGEIIVIWDYPFPKPSPADIERLRIMDSNTPPEPNPLEIRLAALESKAEITDADKQAARDKLISERTR